MASKCLEVCGVLSSLYQPSGLQAQKVIEQIGVLLHTKGHSHQSCLIRPSGTCLEFGNDTVLTGPPSPVENYLLPMFSTQYVTGVFICWDGMTLGRRKMRETQRSVQKALEGLPHWIFLSK